jgi:hypothetical protein
MTFGTIARRTFFDTVIPPKACDVCMCLCFRGKTIVCKFTSGHFITVVIIIHDVVFVGRGNRANNTLIKFHVPLMKKVLLTLAPMFLLIRSN